MDSRHHGQPVVFTTAHGRGRTVVLPSCAVRPHCSRIVSLSFATVRFLVRFSAVCYDLSLKRRMYLAYLVCRIHSILSHTLSNSIEEEENRRRGIR